MTIIITKEQARRYMLCKQGLYGEYKFKGENGIIDFIKQAGCIQYDPIDICGKNHELVLQSRIEGFSKDTIFNLLYIKRKLVDYLDKNMSIFPVEDWPYFMRSRKRKKLSENERTDIIEVIEKVYFEIENRGPICSKDIDFGKTINWSWAPTRLSRAVLETLYFQGDLIVHHKKNTIKYYDFARKHIPESILNADDPNISEEEYYKWYVQRRIGALGLLWNRGGDAWLGISGFKANQRISAFNSLIEEKKIIEINIDNISTPFYINSQDTIYLDRIRKEQLKVIRTELIAPLDNMLWDRKMIKMLFDFNYKWEIYTPASERKYGYYVLPVLYGDRFVARIEIIRDKKKKILRIKNFWWEENIEVNDEIINAIKDCITRFAMFNNCNFYQEDTSNSFFLIH